MRSRSFLVCLTIVSLLFLMIGFAQAKSFRYASQGDPRTMDPHAMNEQLTLMVQYQIYDPLIGRDKNLKLEPSLALKWEPVSEKTYRVWLRKGVKFHGGQDFTAEDVQFSIERAKPGHQFRAYLAHITEAKIIDDYTIDITTKDVDPLLPTKLSILLIMDKDWAIQNKCEKVSDIGKDKEENFAVRNTNGTGPYILKVREPGVRTVLTRNPNWWGKNEGNVTEATYTQITSAATRVAALLSGELDLVIDPPLQDLPRIQKNPDLKTLQGPELRTILLGLDQHREPSPYIWDKAGNPLQKNPFKDLRVRQAVAHGIDVNTLVKRVMRGHGVPSGIASIPGMNGYFKDLDERPAYNPDKAKKLLADAGYPDGFKVSLFGPNNRYINDEQVMRAIASMLARINIDVQVDAVPRNVFFSRLLKMDTSFYLIGLTSATIDTFDLLVQDLMTKNPPNGQVNFGRWSNAEFDETVTKLKTETDPAKRQDLYYRALKIARDDIGDLRLYHQMIIWAMRKNVDAHLRSDNFVQLKWVNVK